MTTQCLFARSLAALMAFTAGAGAADSPIRVQMIDDFTEAPLHQLMPALSADWDTYYQAAPNVLGHVRQTNLLADDTLGATSRIDIQDHRMLVSTGIGSYFGAFLGYGYDASGGDGGMQADFTGYDHFQIDFERSDLGLVYIVEVVDGKGGLALLSGVLTSEAQSAAHGATLPLADFQGGDAQGNPQDIDWADIRYLIVLFQSGNASGGNDFSITSISAVDRPDKPGAAGE